MEQIVGYPFADEGARPNAADEISLVQQLVVRAQHGQPRHAEIHRERTTRWNPLPGPKTPIENGAAKSIVDLPVNWQSGGAIDSEVQRRHESPGEKVVMPTSPRMAMAQLPISRIFGGHEGIVQTRVNEKENLRGS